MSTTTNCEVCGREAPFWARIKNYCHFRCMACGHIFVFPKPSQEDLNHFYDAGTYYNKADIEKNRLINEATQRVQRLDQLCERLALGRRLLDVGCASGYFLSQASISGWETMGIDRSPQLAQKARERSHSAVVSGLLEQVPLPEGPYSVVTAWEVIEHTLNLREFFAALTRQVAQGGLLALSTPLANGVPAWVLGTRFPMLIPPEHLRLFTRRSINMLASQFGFRELSYRSFSNLGPSSLASGLIRLLFHCNREEAFVLGRKVCDLGAIGAAWVPKVIDWYGYGSEMEIVFKRV